METKGISVAQEAFCDASHVAVGLQHGRVVIDNETPRAAACSTTLFRPQVADHGEDA